jgi:hypothetical protein
VTINRTWSAILRPSTTEAAICRSASFPLAQEPTKAWSIRIFWPATTPTGETFLFIAPGSATALRTWPRSTS